MANFLVDTGVWICLCDERDRAATREEISLIFELIRPHTIVMPWPVAFETLRTRMVSNKIASGILERELKSAPIEFLDDSRYREDAFQLALESSRRGRPLSMVDCLLRLLMEDRNVKVDFFATFNDGDFHDVCAAKGIEMFPGSLDF
ncbi:PIN domain-containing protein [Rhizobium sp. NFR12]|uniref:PIN domain-containing protein n=1 Tax=Rhizobium sp. NFR12 TaxID=1566261 RepID=UPI0008A73B80|nr:PIN domain-containing protein [Rhizobium sp. NFR12]SEH27860.1 Predicted nucleic acid-binding protein, contains PIN domain [Rhizobium sp. NFR12]